MAYYMFYICISPLKDVHALIRAFGAAVLKYYMDLTKDDTDDLGNSDVEKL